MTVSNMLSRPLQVCLSASKRAGRLVSASDASSEDRQRAEEAYYSMLYQYTGGPVNLMYEPRFFTPHPILISDQFLAELKRFHEALAIALNNIVQRWFTDKDAAFPTRMPLMPHEEHLLQWLSDHCEAHPKHAYEGRQGNWRPDLLIPADEQDGFKICEINGRFFSLSLDLGSTIHKAIASKETKPGFVDVPANDHMIEAFFEMFNPDLPIHLVQSPVFFAGQFKPGIMQPFLAWVEKRTGMRPRSVRPEDLCLIPDATSQTGYALYCTQSFSASDPPSSPSSSPKKEETLELIHQVGLQLLDFSALSPEIVRHLALSGANDARTRLLVHDKRILGILHQELDGLVTKHRVLTEEQANLLRRRIVPTIIPGSPEAKQLLDLHREGKLSKDDFIIKPARDARGQGIKFGDELSESSEWGEILAGLQAPALSSDKTTYVIQPIIKQTEEDLFLDEKVGVQRCQRVGTYYSVNGSFVGLGAWRAIVASERVCNMATGKAWKMGSVFVSHE
ncbi:hypothetical protein AFCA_008843 [Aspergillus flavus]|uniref:Glutathione synthetase n=1 Tax=Aspergillus flavus TaxID=5059 RepID=A0AB74CNI2_ASPFL|nr:hypothetical protein AFLA_005517 [Aspergillus flavus NRRL3357]KAJ1705048.1 hypothetical protein NYO67_12795 [Aspergillus flavus]KOC07529.1 hypothetical protein AFLA70_540g000810 [Aspergillus flavus AF70]RMZ48133.1 hypothetical protein CA14_008754 [Aspergillus flavus]UDD61480.1 hypothetical protein AFCA_008843 [Aspergillus flavus]